MSHHLLCIPHSLCRGFSLSQWDLSPLFPSPFDITFQDQKEQYLLWLTGDQPVTVISWKWRPEATLKNRPRASEATAHSSLTVSLGSRPSHSLLLCWWSWQPSTAKPHHPVRLKTTMVRLITCHHRRLKHEIAQPTLVSEVVLLSPHWGRSSVWAPSPMLFSLPTVFSLYTAPSAWQKAQDEQLQKKKRLFWLTVSARSVVECLTLLLWSWGRSQHGGGGELFIYMAAGKQSGKERLGVLVHPNGVTSSNKIPLQNFYPPSAGDQDFSMGILGHI